MKHLDKTEQLTWFHSEIDHRLVFITKVLTILHDIDMAYMVLLSDGGEERENGRARRPSLGGRTQAKLYKSGLAC